MTPPAGIVVDMFDTLTVHREHDLPSGITVVGEPPQTIAVSLTLLLSRPGAGDPLWFTLDPDGETVRFRFDNMDLDYRIVGWDGRSRALIMVLTHREDKP